MSQRRIDIERFLNTERLRPLQIRVFVICFFVAALDGFDTQSIAFVAPALNDAWQIDPAAMGSLFGAGLFGTMLGAFSLGTLADYLGRRLMIFLSVLLFGVMSLLCATATSVETLMIYRFIAGIGLGGAMPNILALSSEYAPARIRASSVTAMFCGFPLGAIFGGVASAGILSLYDWKAVFILGGVLPLLLLPIILFWLPESLYFLAIRRERISDAKKILYKIDPSLDLTQEITFSQTKTQAHERGVKNLFINDRAVWTLLLWMVLFSSLLLAYFLINWIPSILANTGLSHEKAVLGAVVLNLGGVLGSIVISRFSDKIGPFIVLGLAYALGSLGVVGIGLISGNLMVGMVLIFVTGFFIMGAQLSMAAVSANYYPSYLRGTGVGWSMGVARFGSILGPVIGGLLLSIGLDVRGLFLFAAVPALIAGSGVYIMSKYIPRTIKVKSVNESVQI